MYWLQGEPQKNDSWRHALNARESKSGLVRFSSPAVSACTLLASPVETNPVEQGELPRDLPLACGRGRRRSGGFRELLSQLRNLIG